MVKESRQPMIIARKSGLVSIEIRAKPRRPRGEEREEHRGY
jgi:hypothetical protein